MMVSSMLVLSACGEALTSSQSSQAEGGEEGVRGTVNFYTSQPDADAKELVDAFNEKYPDVQVDIFRSGTEEVISKVMAEQQAGNIQADVLLVADAVTFETLKEQDLLLKHDSSEHAFIPTEFIDQDKMYTGTKVMATVLAVNTNDVKALPSSWSVLTSDQAKGKAIMPSPLYSGAAAYNVGVFSRQSSFGWDYFEQLSENGMTVVQGNGAALQAVTGGEKAYAMVVDFIVTRAKSEGSPVDIIYPDEGVPVITEPIGIMSNTDNEAASKAFVDFVLSDVGQQLAANLGYTPIREGIDAPEGLKSINELKVLSHDVKELLEAREHDKQMFSNILGE